MGEAADDVLEDRRRVLVMFNAKEKFDKGKASAQTPRKTTRANQPRQKKLVAAAAAAMPADSSSSTWPSRHRKAAPVAAIEIEDDPVELYVDDDDGK